MPALGLGTAQFGSAYGVSNQSGQVSTIEIAAILDTAARWHVNLIDTAAAYGSAEEILGAALRPNAPFRIVTKTTSLTEGVDHVVTRVRRSLELLQHRRIDALLVHSAGDLTGHQGDHLWDALLRLKTDGLFARIGISAYVADDPVSLARRFRPDVVQIPASIFDQRLITNGALAELKRYSIEVHVRSIFLQGLLFFEPEQLPPRLAFAAGHLRMARRLIRDGGSTPLGAAVSFAMSRPEFDIVLVGVTTARQLLLIVKAVQRAAPALDWKAFASTDEKLLTPSLW